MLEKNTAIRPVVLATALTLACLCAFGQVVAPPRPGVQVMARSLALPAAIPVVKPAYVRDADLAARAPFQATVDLNINNFTYTSVAIPAGQRLVIDYVSIAGTAGSPSGPIQPIALLLASVAGNPSAIFYMAPTASTTLATQFYRNESVAIYADTLQVGPAYAGYTPNYMAMEVNISGHLVSLP